MVLDNHFLLLLSFRILRFSSIEFSRDLRGMIRFFRKRAVSLDLAIATTVAVCVPAFPYIVILNSNGSGLSQNNKTRKINRKTFVRFAYQCTTRSTKGDEKLKYKLYLVQFTCKIIGNCKPPSVKL